MRTLILATALWSAGLAQTADELTAMERFAAQSAVRENKTEILGTVASGAVKATISRVALSDGAREMRGLRIDIADGDLTDRVYIEEPFVPAVIDSLTEITAAPVRSGCTGSCTFLTAMREGAHFFFASQCGRDVVITTGKLRVRFADTDASIFAKVLRPDPRPR